MVKIRDGGKVELVDLGHGDWGLRDPRDGAVYTLRAPSLSDLKKGSLVIKVAKCESGHSELIGRVGVVKDVPCCRFSDGADVSVARGESVCCSRLSELRVLPGAGGPPPKEEKIRNVKAKVSLGGLINEEGLTNLVEALVKDKLEAMIAERVSPQRIIIESREPGQEPKVVELAAQHYKFPLLLACVKAGLNVALVGPCGIGKTTTAENIALAMARPFFAASFCRMSTKSDLLGYKDAVGTYHPTAFRTAFEHGGVFCADEFDAGNENVNVVLNAALSNGLCSFPDGMVKRHKDFVAIACMNTYGSGGNRVYVGRNQLDAATMDRFVVIDWDLDESIEARMADVMRAAPEFKLDAGKAVTRGEWLAYVRDVRQAAEEAEVRHVISPRATLFGVKLIEQGVGRKHIEELVLWKGLDKEQRGRIVGRLGGK